GHFYPIVNQKERNSKQKTISNVLRKSDVVRRSKAASEEAKAKKDYAGIKSFEDVNNPLDIMADAIIKTGKQPQDANIYYDGEVQSFELENELYMINQNAEMLRGVYEKIGEPYAGQSLSTALFDIIDKVAKVKIPRSTPNPYVYKTLIEEGVKGRTHYGCVNDFDEETILKLKKEGKVQCLDIKRAYLACMYNPYDNWMLLDYNDNWEDFAGDYTQRGLYFVETADYTLLHGNNIYSNKILEKAAAENIRFKCTKQLLSTGSAPADFFRPIFDAIISIFGENHPVSKLMYCMFTGYIGKHMKNFYKVRMNSCIDSVWNWFQKQGVIGAKNIFVRTMELGDQKTYLFGQKFTSLQSEVNIPMFIQLKDYADMRLYDMITEMGGTLAFRKVDCAVTVGGKYPETSNEWGGYRVSELPKTLGSQVKRDTKFIKEPQWEVSLLNDSDQWEEIMRVAEENGGIMIKGRAGTGKSYAAQMIASKLGWRKKSKKTELMPVEKIAYTNKAALNIQGSTIHKFLKIDKQGNFSAERIKRLRETVKYVVVDEISMIPKGIWRRLVELKRATGIVFILVGDYRQCGPVETERIESYFDHPAVKFLANNACVELTVRRRYDERLWDLLEDVDSVDCSEFGGTICDRNICFYNRTRKMVNRLLMKKHKPQDAMLLKYDGSIEEDKYPQDVWLYKGLPVIARTTIDEGNVMVNNEYFNVTNVTKTHVVCESTRPDDEGEPEKHEVKIELEKFHDMFLANYCSTTHKAQGETITENFTIWDWYSMDRRLKYTAMSRAKKPEQVNFARGGSGLQPATDGDDNTTRLRKVVAKKIAAHKSVGVKKGLITDIDTAYICNLYKKQHRLCYHCHEDIDIEGGDKQLSIDRVNNDLGHMKGNVVISCWSCNRKHMNEKL
ncbi:MAG: hypothetical protein EOM62_15205, partial [Bacteroidia bacterium]|nr:hypothetical protein [Bacteroidia bacterium]